MAAISLAIIGKDREPLYLREFRDLPQLSSDDYISEEEFFGLTTPSMDDKGAVSNTTRIGGFECSIRHQFILHAALDRYEQLAGPSTGLGFRTSGASGNDAMFVGLLCPVEEMRVYGETELMHVKLI
jgi:hypothetical protein